MKKMIEKVIPKEANLFEVIADYIRQYEGACWIYIDKELEGRLNEQYGRATHEGMFGYHIDEHVELWVRHDFYWDRIINVKVFQDATMTKLPYIRDNPEYVIFLSGSPSYWKSHNNWKERLRKLLYSVANKL